MNRSMEILRSWKYRFFALTCLRLMVFCDLRNELDVTFTAATCYHSFQRHCFSHSLNIEYTIKRELMQNDCSRPLQRSWTRWSSTRDHRKKRSPVKPHPLRMSSGEFSSLISSRCEWYRLAPKCMTWALKESLVSLCWFLLILSIEFNYQLQLLKTLTRNESHCKQWSRYTWLLHRKSRWNCWYVTSSLQQDHSIKQPTYSSLKASDINCDNIDEYLV